MNKCNWCGNDGVYYFKTSNIYCCSPFPQQCQAFKKQLQNSKIGKTRSIDSIKKQSKSMVGRSTKPKAKKINTSILCEYGCGKKASFIFKNGKYCCTDDYRKCLNIVKNRTKKNTGKKRTHEFKILMSDINKNKYVSDRTRKKLSTISKKSLLYWKNKYPFFSKIEGMRYNPDKPGEKEIQVHCKNHNCPNSKEQGGWFTPTYIQLYERIRQLESPYGNGGSYFYCSDKCKKTCILYNLQSDPLKDNDFSYTPEEKAIWREEVFRRDNYECQGCGKKENLHAHHIHPIKLEPGYALDPENGITLCEECHYKIGHKDECSTGKLANKICKSTR